MSREDIRIFRETFSQRYSFFRGAIRDIDKFTPQLHNVHSSSAKRGVEKRQNG